jgi:hypothetical protein
MPARIDHVTAPARTGATRTVVSTTLYDLIAAVQDAIEPGEEAYVPAVVAHLLRTGHARFLSDVDVDTFADDDALADLPAEDCCVPA